MLRLDGPWVSGYKFLSVKRKFLFNTKFEDALWHQWCETFILRYLIIIQQKWGNKEVEVIYKYIHRWKKILGPDND